MRLVMHTEHINGMCARADNLGLHEALATAWASVSLRKLPVVANKPTLLVRALSILPSS